MFAHDGLINIAVGRSRKETQWKNKELLWSGLVAQLADTHRTAETYAEYISSSKPRQDEIKDIGGFIGGYVSGGRRKASNITNRCLLTLDIDFGTKDIFDDLVMLYGCACVMYSTHKSSPNQFRGRLVIPLYRPVFRDEYQAITRKIAGTVGIDAFDDTTFQPERLMYWPSTSKDGEWVFEHNDGPFLNADEILASYLDWKDVSNWPTSSRTTNLIVHEIKKQEDPLEKPGLIGAFCRVYDIHTAIETFLTDEYALCADGRYTYTQGSTTAGLVTYEDKFAYSHHGSDPASGKLMNAFDLVRLHKFGLKDEGIKENTPVNKLPSYTAMLDFAAELSEVRRLKVTERLGGARVDFNNVALDEDTSWHQELGVDRKGNIEKTLANLILILQKDPMLANIVFNELSGSKEIIGPVPWNSAGPSWRDADDAQLVSYIDTKYASFTARQHIVAIAKVADDRSYHPIRNYLAALPGWDGIPRVDTLLVDYLGAPNNAYVRAVTRKWLCAAIARVKNPGCKFDCMPVLNGPQGVGKSTLVSRLGMAWFSDSLQLSDTQDKTAAEKLQGFWVLEIGELAGLKKAEVETLRGFISRQDDKYRASFGRNVTSHPRQCVFVGTTNAESGYLRDTAGNRRFWPINVAGGADKKPWGLSQDEVNQVWAEATVLLNAGEKLYLDDKAVLAHAEREQREAMETDDREGMVREYLDTLLPENWDGMELYDRREWLKTPTTRSAGSIRKERVCPQEIWAECYGNRPADLKHADSRAINQILTRLEGWGKAPKVTRFPIYGVCRGFERM